MTSSLSSGRLGTIALLTAASALVLTGCGNSETRNPATGEIVEGGTTDIFTLQIGDCIVDPAAAGATSDDPVETASVSTVPCAESHDYEVYFHSTVSLTEYPEDEDELWYEGEEICYNAFQSFVGTPYETSTLDFFYYVPTKESWTLANDRAVDCLVFDPAGPVTGSLKNSQR